MYIFLICRSINFQTFGNFKNSEGRLEEKKEEEKMTRQDSREKFKNFFQRQYSEKCGNAYLIQGFLRSDRGDSVPFSPEKNEKDSDSGANDS